MGRRHLLARDGLEVEDVERVGGRCNQFRFLLRRLLEQRESLRAVARRSAEQACEGTDVDSREEWAAGGERQEAASREWVVRTNRHAGRGRRIPRSRTCDTPPHGRKDDSPARICESRRTRWILYEWTRSICAPPASATSASSTTTSTIGSTTSSTPPARSAWRRAPTPSHRRATPSAPAAASDAQYLREYLRWLWPHRFAIGAVFVLRAGRRRPGDGRAAVHAVHRRPRAAEHDARHARRG